MIRRSAFTLLELVFVIVIIGIIGKFGVEFLAQAYKNYIFTTVNNSLQAESGAAVEFISTRLQHRIKDSIIARVDDANFTALTSASGSAYTILEWVGTDVDDFRGNSLPNWSGIVDLDLSSSSFIYSPQTNTTAINALIATLSYGDSNISKAALYFVGSNSDIQTGYGWNGQINDQNQTMHPINLDANTSKFVSRAGLGNFSEIYEYYKLAWTAYAVVHANNNLTLYYDYQPWNGDTYHNGKSAVIMENVDTFQFMAVGSLVKIQVCVNSNLVEDYSICKEKTIY